MLTQCHSYDCNGTGAQKWQLNKGNGAVKVAGTNFCLDAGSSESPLALSSATSEIQNKC